MSGNNTADIFSSLLSDPAALSAIASLLSSQPKPEAPPPPDGEAPSESEPSAGGAQSASASAVGMGGMGDMLGALMQNPQLLSALPSIMSALSGMGSTFSQRAQAPHEQGEAGSFYAGPFSSAAPLPKPPRPTDRRSALLLALKPYMPEEKRETIDTIVRIIEIMSLIK